MKCKYLFFNIAMTFSFGENNKKTQNGSTSLLSAIELSIICLVLLSCVRVFVTPWATDCQTPLFMKFSRQE